MGTLKSLTEEPKAPVDRKHEIPQYETPFKFEPLSTEEAEKPEDDSLDEIIKEEEKK